MNFYQRKRLFPGGYDKSYADVLKRLEELSEALPEGVVNKESFKSSWEGEALVTQILIRRFVTWLGHNRISDCQIKTTVGSG